MTLVDPNCLDLDVGNTRLKWRLSRNGVVLVSGSTGHSVEELGEAVSGHAGGIKRCRLASVAGELVNERIRAWVLDRYGVQLERALVSAEACGISNSYQRPGEMGVDRWLATVAAYSIYRGACLVVDCGSAVTVELVSAEGRHIGGYIVPGLGLMRRSLFRGTDAVKVGDSGLAPAPVAGTCTSEAVNNGLLLMLLGLVEKSMLELRKAEPSSRPVLVVTGGDGEQLLPHLPEGAIYNAGLVLDGLAVLMP